MKRLIAVVIIVLVLSSAVRAQEMAVIFGDDNLMAAVQAKLNDNFITESDMLDLIELYAGNLGISSLQGLECAINLTHLDLNGNQISDLSPLSGLTNLRNLYLEYNQISKLSPLAGLTDLKRLNLSDNQISNIPPLDGLTKLEELYLNTNQISNLSPLAGLTNLYTLLLNDNQISDISPLVELRKLKDLIIINNQISDISPLVTLADYRLEWVFLYDNPLNREAYDTYIPELLAAGIGVGYDLLIPATVLVPDVVLMTQADAIQALQDKQFTVRIVDAFSETVEAGRVINQDPVGGTWANLGSVVTVTVSEGPPPSDAVVVPDVVRKTKADAEQALTSVGLTMTSLNAPSETVPADHVANQYPVGGSQVAVGSAVTLMISTGPGGGPGSGPRPDLPAPVAHWALDETAGLTAFDSAGSHDGRLYGNPTWQPQGGIIDGALRFDGVDDYVDCGTFNPSAATGKLTVCLWAKWNGLTGSFQGLIGKRDTWDASQMMWQLEASRDGGIVGFFRNGSGSNDGFILPVGQWVHIAATCDGTTARMYLDGQEVVSSPMNFGSDTSASLVFGSCEKDGGNPFNGTLDDVQLYDRVLNAQQIQDVMGGIGTVIWDRAAYWDIRYPANWVRDRSGRDALESAGYEILDADQLKTWMDARISDGVYSVVVFCQDVAPETVYESASSTCTLRRYLDAGGKVVWYGDIPLYYQGHSDGTMTTFDLGGSLGVLGFRAAGGIWEIGNQVTLTDEGRAWGLTNTWPSVRPAQGSGLRVLALDSSGLAAAWVKHYLPGDTYGGFVRFSDCPFAPDIEDIRRLAEYPNTLMPASGGGLVAHYAFEGNAEDSAGGHHGNVHGATWTQGMTGLALRLDGDDYVEVADDVAFDMTKAVSVAAWVNLQAVKADWLGIVTKGDSTWRLSTYLGEQRFHFAVNDLPGSYHTVDGVTYAPLNEWHYVVGTFDGSSIRLYVDGVEDPASPVPYTSAIYIDDYPVWIGANSEQSGRYFVGMIDEVMIYDRALSQTEILSLMAQTD
jgi:hypothetical protein